MLCFFFFKQKTAYDMRISDWSSDVCSSDLLEAQARFEADFTRAIDDAPNLSAAGGQRLWRGHPAIEMVAKVPADDREGDGPMVKRDAGIDFEIIGLRKNIVDAVLVRIFKSEEHSVGQECVKQYKSKWSA